MGTDLGAVSRGGDEYLNPYTKWINNCNIASSVVQEVIVRLSSLT